MPRPLLALAVAALAAPPVFAQGNYDPPKAVPPDAATLKQIEAKRAELAKAITALPEKTPDDVKADVEVYAKAAEWTVRHGEWLTPQMPKQTLAVLDSGLARAKAAADGKTPWRDARNKPVIRGYRSYVDMSVQPYSLLTPEGFVRGEKKKWRLDIVLHGRGATMTEVNFIAGKEAAKPSADKSGFVMEPYGRGNVAYRWASETDIMQAFGQLCNSERALGSLPSHPFGPIVLRGFSMGGAGTWHLGLHHPSDFAVIGPGAGFTTTRGYIKNLPAQLPDYQEKCLHIYDAVDYAENAFNVPVVAYSGANDPQKAAADNIEAAVRRLNEPVRFTHLVAPGLEHKMPTGWQAKADAEYVRFAGEGRKPYPDRVRFVTYTTRYDRCEWITVMRMEQHYKRALVDARTDKGGFEVRTENVRAFAISLPDLTARVEPITIDGQRLPAATGPDVTFCFEKQNGTWAAVDRPKPGKRNSLSGPIDDAFMDLFAVVGPSERGWSDVTGRYVAVDLTRFGREWDKFLRAKLPPEDENIGFANLVLFGDPASNPLIAKVADKLPITWTKDKLVVNGVEYDPKTHVPVLIYPNPLNSDRYVVINSGHTFHAADFKGTNALLYPRLGDWAVLKPTPTEKDPAAAEVVAAGLFDENWQFPKK